MSETQIQIVHEFSNANSILERELTGNKLDWLVKGKLSWSKCRSFASNRDALASISFHIQGKLRYKDKGYRSIIPISEEFKKEKLLIIIFYWYQTPDI